MNDLADELDPRYRSWLLSQAVPQVWAATFSLHLDKGEGTAIATADAAAGVVKRLKDEPALPPEDVVAKSGFVFSFDDFRGWYRVTHRLQQPSGSIYRDPTDTEIEQAFESYQQSRSDFY
ncbi:MULTISPECIES: hypothetical protein [Xanthomonas]|uniref:hypothetical protein n=1 Tax=Xanthomonas TaxID=338 RepID=UPI001ADAD9D0|nr:MULTISPECIES: hypothetical protein [unclassified Xanthomonas]MBO9873534.1 hypothetical protein [Xanthomonas sp. D-93]WNH45316.1 hypothetical protein PG878_02250 [Xanthomonas sp. A6251]